MIDTWSSCSYQSPWLPCSGHTISCTGPSVSPFRDFFIQLFWDENWLGMWSAENGLKYANKLSKRYSTRNMFDQQMRFWIKTSRAFCFQGKAGAFWHSSFWLTDSLLSHRHSEWGYAYERDPTSHPYSKFGAADKNVSHQRVQVIMEVFNVLLPYLND